MLLLLRAPQTCREAWPKPGAFKWAYSLGALSSLSFLRGVFVFGLLGALGRPPGFERVGAPRLSAEPRGASPPGSTRLFPTNEGGTQ